MIVVSNSSPLIALSAVGRFDLLHQLYDEISIPEAVRQEVVEASAGRAGSVEIEAASWVFSYPVKGDFLLRALMGELDRGEAEAIALGVERRADLVLMDERRGRKVADRFGLKAVGVLGVLIEAKGKRALRHIKPALDDLLTKAGFRVSEALYRRVLEEAGEISSESP